MLILSNLPIESVEEGDYINPLFPIEEMNDLSADSDVTPFIENSLAYGCDYKTFDTNSFKKLLGQYVDNISMADYLEIVIWAEKYGLELAWFVISYHVDEDILDSPVRFRLYNLTADVTKAAYVKKEKYGFYGSGSMVDYLDFVMKALKERSVYSMESIVGYLPYGVRVTFKTGE